MKLFHVEQFIINLPRVLTENTKNKDFKYIFLLFLRVSVGILCAVIGYTPYFNHIKKCFTWNYHTLPYLCRNVSRKTFFKLLSFCFT